MKPREFSAREFIQTTMEEIRNIVGDSEVLAACSGGVDSTTAAVLVARALGRPIKAVVLDDGLRREGEPRSAVHTLKRLGLNAFLVNVSEEVLGALKGIGDPEEKRIVFREVFYTILGRLLKEEGAEFLVQGTIAADVIETVKGIKTQHNVLVQIGIDTTKYGFKLLEPLRSLYKWQVREVARELGLPEEIVNRMPFPGPGLAIRVLGEVTQERLEIVRKATRIVEEETRNIEAFQKFAVLLNDRATGVVEGRRTYGNIIVVRVVESRDALTARAVELPFQVLRRIAYRITQEIPQISRVLYDITDKPPATIEYE
ncbi:MAG: ExsB family transcriptional regulator [Thermoprotei archaeon]|nr:MAG: ExsB family transcriptional regulator [Thermoprotei archaeon]